MKRKFSKRYQRELLTYLRNGAGASLQPAQGMGRHALTAGMKTLDVAKLHEQILVTQVLPHRGAAHRARLIRRAGTFFTEAITPIQRISRGARDSEIRLNQIVEMLSQRTVELAASNVDLKREIVQRKVVEAALKKSELHHSLLLIRSERMQEQLRQLSRQILLAQESERREISRELHDVIAQTLTGINVRLAALKTEAAVNSKGLDRNIARTQRLVAKSVNIVHQFARELRPAVLDDLGLIPALHSFVKAFSLRTGIHVHLKVTVGVEQLDANQRTILYRVAQEALTNVARHAKAARVEVNVRTDGSSVSMKVWDDGKSFNVERVLSANSGKHLGLLGMRERIEMVGGSFSVASRPGWGTAVQARIPLGPIGRGKSKNRKPAVEAGRREGGESL